MTQQIVGVSYSQQNPDHQAGFIWTAQTGMQVIDGAASASGINANGDIAGTSLALRATIFTATGATIDLGTLGDFSIATSVNDIRHAVGYSPTQSGGPVHAFFYNGVLQDLGTIQTGSNTTTVSVNNADIVVGSSNLAGHSVPFVWSATTGMQDLNTLISPDSGWTLVTASGVDAIGEIVGAGGINGAIHGFMLVPGN